MITLYKEVKAAISRRTNTGLSRLATPAAMRPGGREGDGAAFNRWRLNYQRSRSSAAGDFASWRGPMAAGDFAFTLCQQPSKVTSSIASKMSCLASGEHESSRDWPQYFRRENRSRNHLAWETGRSGRECRHFSDGSAASGRFFTEKMVPEDMASVIRWEAGLSLRLLCANEPASTGPSAIPSLREGRSPYELGRVREGVVTGEFEF